MSLVIIALGAPNARATRDLVVTSTGPTTPLNIHNSHGGKEEQNAYFVTEEDPFYTTSVSYPGYLWLSRNSDTD